jgi:TolB protein
VPISCRRLWRTALLTPFVLILGLSSAWPQPASRPIAPGEVIDIGVVRPIVRTREIIAIPDFDPKGSSAFKDSALLTSIIYNDLELSGYFKRPEHQKFVEQNHTADSRSGKIDFAEWARLPAAFLLEGTYGLSEDQLEVECLLYDVASGKRIFGRAFSDYTLAEHRTLAHRISDLVVKYITHEEGIANTKILFVSSRTGHKEIFIMDADGYNQHPLTAERSLTATPCWGANATEAYYTTYRDYNPDLCGVYINGGKPWFISRRPGFNISPAWSEKAQRMVLTLGKDGNSEIYLMDRNGQQLKRLTYNRAIDSSPCWSPQGNQIVFTSDRSGQPQLYIMDAEGLNTRRLTYKGTYNDSAAWSPKGDKIAFAARYLGVFNIYLIDLETSDWIQLTQNQGNNEDPSWAPDGQHLVFASDRTGTAEIYVMCIDGSGQTCLTSMGMNHSPAWSPAIP